LLVAAVAALVGTPRPAAASCVPGFDYAAFGKTSVDFGGDSTCDSWNSASGTYAATQSNTGGNLGTNGTQSGALTVHGTASSVFGNLYYGVGGTDSTVTIHGQPTTGSSGALTSTLALPSVTIPTLGSNLGALGSGVLIPNNTYTTVSGSVIALPGSYVIGTLTANLTVNVGPVVIYITNNFNPGTITNATGIPGNLVFMVGPGVGSIDLTDVGGVYAIYAPDSDVAFHGNQDVYGAIISKSLEITGTPAIHYDRALNNLAVGGFSCPGSDISRASPVVATVANQTSVVQGTFQAPTGPQTSITSVASVIGFTFPYIRGHLRVRVASTITSIASSFSSGTVVFDAAAAGKLPVVNNTACSTFTGSCRHVFTNTNAAASTGATFHPAMVTLSDSTSNAIGALIAPTSVVSGIAAAQWQTIVRTVLGGPLGGIDRSTAAVIPASQFAGLGTRPTMVYFGATDGMLHAVCASSGGTTASSSNICPSLGTELWAFLPRVQLPLIRTNNERIDGSPRVNDVFGDFTNNPATGAKSWHTILTFQTGFAVGSTAATYALDITDPANPTLLWEVATPTSPGSIALGTGLTVAVGPAMIAGQRTNLAVVETKNGGTGGAGVVVTALQQETGSTLWASSFGYLYPASPGPRGVAADLPLPSTGIPGGAVAVDLSGQGFMTDIVFGDLYGDLWRLAATDGTSRNGTNTPLFSFSSNRHPIGAVPAIYSSGTSQFAVVASGGYADPNQMSWTTGTQYLIAAKLSSTAATISEATSACATCALALNQTLTAGDRGFSQVLVVGSKLLVTTDSTDINLSTFGGSTNTGHVTDVDLKGVAATSVVVVNSGASSLVNQGTTLYSSASTQQQQLTTSSTTGVTVDMAAIPKFVRNLWLRTQ
jgi:hypothetical protein